jgi:hypothetical protein
MQDCLAGASHSERLITLLWGTHTCAVYLCRMPVPVPYTCACAVYLCRMPVPVPGRGYLDVAGDDPAGLGEGPDISDNNGR